MFKPRPETKAGDRLTLDPIRKAWRLFLGNVFLGELVNPLVPKQTGSWLADRFPHGTVVDVLIIIDL